MSEKLYWGSVWVFVTSVMLLVMLHSVSNALNYILIALIFIGSAGIPLSQGWKEEDPMMQDLRKIGWHGLSQKEKNFFSILFIVVYGLAGWALANARLFVFIPALVLIFFAWFFGLKFYVRRKKKITTLKVNQKARSRSRIFFSEDD